MKNAPATITKIIAATFSITIKLFAFAAPLVPLNNIEITTRTMINAGKFMEKPEFPAAKYV